VTLEPSVAVEALGWAATATFAGSYLSKRAETLVRVQLAGALMWAVYGVLVRSAPVIAANVLVVAAAAWKARASRARHFSVSPAGAGERVGDPHPLPRSASLRGGEGTSSS
jgi:hypothetical protein